MAPHGVPHAPATHQATVWRGILTQAPAKRKDGDLNELLKATKNNAFFRRFEMPDDACKNMCRELSMSLAIFPSSRTHDGLKNSRLIFGTVASFEFEFVPVDFFLPVIPWTRPFPQPGCN